jgi:hypothetical protein
LEKQLAQLHLLMSLKDDIEPTDFRYLYTKIMNEIRNSDAACNNPHINTHMRKS